MGALRQLGDRSISLTKPRWSGSGARRSPTAGFTFLEVLSVVVLMGGMAAIAAPGWIQFHDGRRLGAAQQQIYQAIRQAQHEAKVHHLNWQVSFQNVDGRGQMAIHPSTMLPVDAHWRTLPQGVWIDTDETTLREDEGAYEVEFNSKGHVNGQLGRVTVKASDRHQMRRCVFVSTLIGGLREAEDNPTPRRGRFCY